jgi:hypothetical protein
MFSGLKDRMEKRAIATAIIAPLVLVVIAFLALASYFALRESLSPSLAALVTAAAGVVLIAVVLLITRISAREPQPEQPPTRDLPEEVERVLQDQVDPLISDWVRNNPDRAAIASLLLGIAAGYSDAFQKILLDVYSRYSQAERARHPGRNR